MLPHYSPLKVAETFTILAGLFPGRIDLGLGRAAGTDPMTTFALQRDRRQAAPDDFPQQLAELLAYLDDNLPEGHPFARLAGVLPGRPELPVPWLLGSSPQSAIWAGELALPYAFADFINSEGADIAKLYRERFVPTEHSPVPRTAVAVWVLCAATDEEAQYLATSSRMCFTLLHRNQLIPVPPPDEGGRVLPARGQEPLGRTPGPAQHPRVAREGARRRRGGRGRVRRRGGDRGHDHLRPPGAPALLRAAGRGVRPRAARAQDAQRSSRRADEALGHRVADPAEREEPGNVEVGHEVEPRSGSDPPPLTRQFTSNFSPSDP